MVEVGYLHTLGAIRTFPRGRYVVSPVRVTQVVEPEYGVHTGNEGDGELVARG